MYPCLYWMPRALMRKQNMSVYSSILLVVGLPAPWPAFVSSRIISGFLWPANKTILSWHPHPFCPLRLNWTWAKICFPTRWGGKTEPYHCNQGCGSGTAIYFTSWIRNRFLIYLLDPGQVGKNSQITTENMHGKKKSRREKFKNKNRKMHGNYFVIIVIFLKLTHYPPRVDVSTTWLYFFENSPKIHSLIYCFHVWKT